MDRLWGALGCGLFGLVLLVVVALATAFASDRYAQASNAQAVTAYAQEQGQTERLRISEESRSERLQTVALAMTHGLDVVAVAFASSGVMQTLIIVGVLAGGAYLMRRAQ